MRRGFDGAATPRQQLESPEWARYVAQPENQYFKLNLQQMNKTPVLMDCIRAPAGYKFVQLDFVALEPMVLAEFSRDATYQEIYASGKPHDIYLYIICQMFDPTGEVSAVYNPENPTKESVSAAKKQFKTQRTMGKIFQLMSTYKAGAKKIHRKLTLAGVDISPEAVVELRRNYWENVFPGVTAFEEHLRAQRDQNGGWIYNGTDRPLVITDKKEKDLVNSYIQSTGHDYTDLMVLAVEQLARDAGIPAEECIPDFHDETIWLVRAEYANQLALTLTAAVGIVNERIQFESPLQGTPEIADTFTQFKNPDGVDWYTARKAQVEPKGM